MSSAALRGKLAYRFSDESLLTTALSHRSSGARNYERLEFLGDAVLGLLVSEALYQYFPGVKEGELSRYRADLVQQSTLAELARSLDLGSLLILGKGERMAGGASRDSILADAFEALACAIYLDGGIEACRQAIIPLFEQRMKALGPVVKDPKTRLQEFLQARRKPLPRYEVSQVEGDDHNQVFHITCLVDSLPLGVPGRGHSRKEAEQQAAALCLEQLEASQT